MAIFQRFTTSSRRSSSFRRPPSGLLFLVAIKATKRVECCHAFCQFEWQRRVQLSILPQIGIEFVCDFNKRQQYSGVSKQRQWGGNRWVGERMSNDPPAHNNYHRKPNTALARPNHRLTCYKISVERPVPVRSIRIKRAVPTGIGRHARHLVLCSSPSHKDVLLQNEFTVGGSTQCNQVIT